MAEADSLRVGILGTRGIPNNYGGFERLAEVLSVELVERGHSVTVFNPHDHPFEGESFKGVTIERVYHPEKRVGAAANLLFDLLGLIRAKRTGFDVLLELGYGSVAIWYPLLAPGERIVTNMDGLEWRRQKWGRLTRLFTLLSERIACAFSDELIADNPVVGEDLLSRHNVKSVYIPYGADVLQQSNDSCLSAYGVKAQGYDLVISRLEPENNVSMIIASRGFMNDGVPLIVVGPTDTSHARDLQTAASGADVRFLGGIYDQGCLDALRVSSRLYLHGHSVGGTNPSLLEAMGAGACVVAHDNPFNRYVLTNEGVFFANARQLAESCGCLAKSPEARDGYRRQLEERVRTEYNWARVVDAYEETLMRVAAS